MSYTKTNWQDLPNTSTPINATNLNKMEQGIYDANDKNIITIGLNSDSSITATSAYQTTDVNLTKEVAKSGTKLSLSSGKVAIGAGVSKVLVSANAMTQGDAGSFGFMIRKNTNTEVAVSYAAPSGTGWLHIALTPVLVNVSQGDTLKLTVYINNNNSTKNIKAYNGTGTYLTVQVVE